MELIIALGLFVGMIVSWAVLPGDTAARVASDEMDVVMPGSVQRTA